MNNLCVSLSGIGFAGSATVTLRDCLQQQAVEPHLIIGCGGSALIAALWAANYSVDETLKYVHKLYDNKRILQLNLKTVLSFYTSVFGEIARKDALFKNHKYLGFLKEVFGDTKIENLPKRLLLQSTDISTGESVTISEGCLYKAVYASSSMLPFMPAIEIDGKWLASGNFSNPLPIDVAVIENSDFVITFNMTSDKEDEGRTFMQRYSEFINNSSMHGIKYQKLLSTYLHHGEILFLEHQVTHCSSKKKEIDLAVSEAKSYLDSHQDEIQEFCSLFKEHQGRSV